MAKSKKKPARYIGPLAQNGTISRNSKQPSMQPKPPKKKK